ncbi:MAG TPA: MarR family transcriptional regulator [Terriglobales bacterium]|nr:MarR family transcriptional regulator [Terriglobales bacterium]
MRKSKKKSNPNRSTAEIADRVHSAAIHLLRRVRREDSLSGEGPARLSALSVLAFGGPKTLGDLAAAEQVKPPTMTRIVAGLERAGLARRVVDGTDSRRIRVHATAKGMRILQAARKRRIDVLARGFSTLSTHDLVAVERAAEILNDLLEQWS